MLPLLIFVVSRAIRRPTHVLERTEKPNLLQLNKKTKSKTSPWWDNCFVPVRFLGCDTAISPTHAKGNLAPRRKPHASNRSLPLARSLAPVRPPLAPSRDPSPPCSRAPREIPRPRAVVPLARSLAPMWPCPSPCATVRLSPWMLLQIAVLPRSGSGWWPAVTNRRAEQIVDCSSRLPRLGPLAVDGGRLSPAASNQALKVTRHKSPQHAMILFSPLIYRVFSSPSIPEKF